MRCPLCAAFVLAVGMMVRAGRVVEEATDFSSFKASDVFERDGYICYLCGGLCSGKRPDPMSPSLDHVVPVMRGGKHTLDNVRTAHLLCNMSKGVRDLEIATGS